MQPVRPIADRLALVRQRRRAMKNPALFVHQQVAAEIDERLAEVNRTFTKPLVVTPFEQVWRKHLPDARIIADLDVLDVQPGTHDLVIHALCLHWANDPVGQIVQCRRALLPDGLFLGVAFGGRTLAELRTCLAKAEIANTGGLSPRVLPMAEVRDMGSLLQRAGLALPVADSQKILVSYVDAFALMRDLRAMGEANALNDRVRRPTRRSVLFDAADLYAQACGNEDERVDALFELIFLAGWAPHESQQKPLRPGSGQQSLASVLGSGHGGLPQGD